MLGTFMSKFINAMVPHAFSTVWVRLLVPGSKLPPNVILLAWFANHTSSVSDSSSTSQFSAWYWNKNMRP